MASRQFSGILEMVGWTWRNSQALVDAEPKKRRESAYKLSIMGNGDPNSAGII